MWTLSYTFLDNYNIVIAEAIHLQKKDHLFFSVSN